MEESLKKNSMESTDSCGCGCGHDHHEEHEHEEHAHEEHHHHDDEHCGCGCEDHEHEHHHHDHDDDHCDCGCEDHDHEHHEHEHHHHHDDEHCGCGCGDHDHNHEHHEHSHSTASAKRVYILENLGCAHCASKMEEQIQHLDGVESATITFATKQLRLNAADPDALLPQIRKICTSIESEVKVVPRNPKPAASADVITKIYLLENLGCAHCASKMEEQIADLDGISEATITFATKQLRVTAKDPDRYLDQIRKICTSIESEVVVKEKDPKPKSQTAASETHPSSKKKSFSKEKIDTICIIIGAILFVAGEIMEHKGFADTATLPLFVIAYLALGGVIVVKAAKNISHGQVFDENFLMSVATLAAFAINDSAEAVGVMLFYRIGELFEEKAVERSRGQIMDAVDLRPEVVNLVVGDDIQVIPSEEAQFEAYKKVAETLDGKPVIIRTLDIGGDKALPYLGLPTEENPFLGFRAVRFCLQRKEDIYKPQLRALLRASAFGKVRIMVPLVTCVDELRAVKAIIEELKQELDAEGIAYDKDIQVGVMMETAAASLIADILAKEADFFSIGTNDLTQYTLAIDRQNEKLDEFYNPHHEAILRMIQMVVDNAHKEGIWAGICGELGADTTLTERFVEMGLDELSVSPTFVLPVRKIVREME